MNETPSRSGPARRLYEWVLHWADTPYGVPALFLLALAESSFFPIPPDPLLIALCLGAATRSLRLAAITTAASVIGGTIGYGIGAGAWHVAEPWFFDYVPGVSQEAFDGVQALYDRWDFWAIFFAGAHANPLQGLHALGRCLRDQLRSLPRRVGLEPRAAVLRARRTDLQVWQADRGIHRPLFQRARHSVRRSAHRGVYPDRVRTLARCRSRRLFIGVAPVYIWDRRVGIPSFGWNREA